MVTLGLIVAAYAAGAVTWPMVATYVKGKAASVEATVKADIEKKL